jgi:hypothetical protein
LNNAKTFSIVSELLAESWHKVILQNREPLAPTLRLVPPLAPANGKAAESPSIAPGAFSPS